MEYVLLIAGFVLLVKGADFLVDGASSIAKKLGISALVIGLTIVAFGTSAPELIVNIFASLQGNTDIAIGNIVGSNIANILLILGISSIIFPLSVTKGTAWKEIPLSLLAILAVAIMANDKIIDGSQSSVMTRGDGLILIAFFIIFLYYTYGISKVSGQSSENHVKDMAPLKAGFMVLLGLAGLTLGGKWIVDSAVLIATGLGVSQAIIGLTIIAVGTSLPELATSAMAAYKKNSDIAVGNIVGSNIFNIFWILGVSSVVSPLPFAGILNRDVAMAILATLLLFAFLFVGKRHTLERWQGFSFVAIYFLYVGVLISQELL